MNAKVKDSEQQDKNGQVEYDESTPMPTTVTANLQHLSELRKMLTSFEDADEMLSYADKN